MPLLPSHFGGPVEGSSFFFHRPYPGRLTREALENLASRTRDRLLPALGNQSLLVCFTIGSFFDLIPYLLTHDFSDQVVEPPLFPQVQPVVRLSITRILRRIS